MPTIRCWSASRRIADDEGLANLKTVPVEREGLSLPEPVDLIFVSATYHHLPDQAAYFGAAHAFLRPGGRIAIIESRGEGLLRRFFGHATPPAQVHAQMREAGYEPIEEHDGIEGHALHHLPRRRPVAQSSARISSARSS